MKNQSIFIKLSQFISGIVFVISITMSIISYSNPVIFYPWLIATIISFISLANFTFISTSISFFSKLFIKYTKIIIKLSRLIQWILAQYDSNFDSQKETRQAFIKELYSKIKNLDDDLQQLLKDKEETYDQK
ncbi:MAG: hypothetical protein KatS3mg002_0359 [Candidatus Woesearchaeota archaeon]|nr:MAG: hypothetical protein KatS3mg002_0359 [Candidatus Woesearchaeota archaeon]